MALKQGRNYGIDLLRIVSMFMVVILHVLGQGGVLGRTHAYSGQYLVAWFLELAAYCSVNLFALISGYVGITSKYKAANLAVLWLQVFLYSFGIAILYAILKPSLCSFGSIFEYAFPVITKKYWYFSAYVCLFLFMPLLNAGIIALRKETLRRVIFAMLLVFSVGTAIAKEATHDPFVLVSGYTGLWLMILYAVGAYIRKYGLWENLPKPALLGIYFGSTALSLGIKVVVRLISGTPAYNLKFVSSFISPFVVLGSIALLIFFSRLKCSNLVKCGITLLAPASFGVYILHVHPLIWENVMKGRFVFLAKLNAGLLALCVPLVALGIYLLCSLIDTMRVLAFNVLRVKERCTALEEKLFREKQKIGDRE